jgi:hypothetical protein
VTTSAASRGHQARAHWGCCPDSRESHFQRRFFAAEAALVGRLHHPNVVQIFDAVFDDEAPYLVMEYVQGVTLRRFCRADNAAAAGRRSWKSASSAPWRWATSTARG